MFCFRMSDKIASSLEGKVAYLLGSGLSIPFCLPGVPELTELILNSDRYASLNTDQCFHVDLPPQRFIIPCEHNIPETIAAEFIRFVQVILLRDTMEKRTNYPNYEDIADFIMQFQLSIAQQYENPALGLSYLKEIENFATQRNKNLSRLLEYSIRLMDCILSYFLNHNHSVLLREMKLIQNVIPDVLLGSRINIFSLNHDMIMEDYFMTRDIKYDDGFYPDHNGVYYFNFKRFWNSNEIVRMVKLHGSIDRYYHNKSMIRAPDPRNINEPRSNKFADNFIPSILSGKIVKMLDYSKPIHAELNAYFRIKLATEISKLVVVGYGFGDKGINNTISSWFESNDENRMIVVTLDKKLLLDSSRLAIYRLFMNSDYIDNRRIVILEGGIESLTNTSILDALK